MYMKIYEGLDQFQPIEHAVVTSGTFDGVHIGHRKILSRIQEIARKQNGETVLITFWPHPRLVLFPDEHNLQLLNTFEEKIELLEQQGIDHLVKIAFTQEFSQTTSSDFIDEILVKGIGTKTLVIGYDHRFGRNREGSFESLKQNAGTYGFGVEEIPHQDIHHVTVSSTKIRKALQEGKVEIAHEYLNQPYQINGIVVAGDKIGREIGFPTANIRIASPYKLIPQDGIYAVKVRHGSVWYGGMLYIGNRPTLNAENRSIEVNIFDFDQEIYDDQLRIEFIQQIRNDSKFENLDDLRHQLSRDKVAASKILSLK